MADDLDDAIQQNAEGPAEARGDSGSVRQHSLRGQVEVGRETGSARPPTRAQKKPSRRTCVHPEGP